MDKHHVSSVALFGALLILIIFPNFSTALAFSAGCALYGFLHFIEKRRTNEIAELREEFEKQMKELKSRVDGLTLRGTR